MSVLKQRSVMTLFSGDSDIYSHQVRIALLAKDINNVGIISVDSKNPQDDFLELSPYHSLPLLVDRELALYQPTIIMEYLDERFPHPPMLPVYPVAKAKCRLMMYRIEEDWYSQIRIIETGSPKAAKEARKVLSDTLTKLAPVFGEMPFFLSSELSLIDCCVAPLLWRLPHLGITLPADRAKPIFEYEKRLFNMSIFRSSLTDVEREMRE